MLQTYLPGCGADPYALSPWDSDVFIDAVETLAEQCFQERRYCLRGDAADYLQRLDLDARHNVWANCDGDAVEELTAAVNDRINSLRDEEAAA